MSSSKEEKGVFQNWISVVGTIGAIVSFGFILFLIAIEAFSGAGNPYVKTFLYLISPVALIFFLFLIPLGALLERRWRKKKGYVQRFPKIDFNDLRHQKIAYMIIGITTVFGLFVIVGTYQAYEFTGSNTFCGQVCHVVMRPEFTAYQNSPHAKVPCVDCHVGHGVQHYVSAKVRGMNQLFKLLSGDVDKPIPTPVASMQPARETCENCHWSEKHFGVIGKEFNYFLSDENNTEWTTQMLIYVSGTREQFGDQQGVHWHMHLENQVSYIATDEKRLTIPWVKKMYPDGREEVFVDEESQDYTLEGNPRIMDCMDCHNRPSHRYLSPAQAVNQAMAKGEIVKTLPFIKREAVKVLTGEYASHEEAAEQIQKSLEAFYHESNERGEDVEQSIRGVIAVYKKNFFPEMRVSWREYPDHIGHFHYPGCFRCHDGKHKSAEGNEISNRCSICHLILQQGEVSDLEESVDGLEFRHPENIGEIWKGMPCSDCHDGA